MQAHKAVREWELGTSGASAPSTTACLLHYLRIAHVFSRAFQLLVLRPKHCGLHAKHSAGLGSLARAQPRPCCRVQTRTNLRIQLSAVGPDQARRFVGVLVPPGRLLVVHGGNGGRLAPGRLGQLELQRQVVLIVADHNVVRVQAI